MQVLCGCCSISVLKEYCCFWAIFTGVVAVSEEYSEKPSRKQQRDLNGREAYCLNLMESLANKYVYSVYL